MGVNWLEVEELAVAVLGMDEDNYDSDDVEQALYDRFEISMESFHKIVEALVPFAVPVQAGFSADRFQGFVKDGALIVKVPYAGGA